LFARVNSLKFDLLADEDGKVAQAFGVPVREGDTITRMVEGVEQTLKRGVTASRWTFIIGKDGRIIRKNTMVDAEQDYRKVLETVRRLTADAE
jgi:peroxiredoxin Q/BCP